MTIRSWADEARSPKYSHVERERRWRVDARRLPPLPAGHVAIKDRYIIGTRLRLRHMRDNETGLVAYKLAKKYEADDVTARPMVNAYLTVGEHAVFAELPAYVIRKRRYVIGAFSVDVFAGDLTGLVLAEIEQTTPEALAAISAPDWTVREVTQDARFQGGLLARMSATELAKLLD